MKDALIFDIETVAGLTPDNRDRQGENG